MLTNMTVILALGVSYNFTQNSGKELLIPDTWEILDTFLVVSNSNGTQIFLK